MSRIAFKFLCQPRAALASAAALAFAIAAQAPASAARSRSSSPSAPAASPASTTRSAARSAGWSTRTAPSTGIRCSVESTGGSVYNVNAVKIGRARLRHDAIRRAVPGLQRHRAVQGGGQGRCARCSRFIRSRSPGRAQGGEHQAVHRFQGQALQRRQSGLGHALGDGGAARRART